MRKNIYSYVIFIHWNLLKKNTAYHSHLFSSISLILSLYHLMCPYICLCLSLSFSHICPFINLSILTFYLCLCLCLCLSFFYSSPSLSISIYDVIIEVHNCLQCPINSQSLWGQCDHLTKTWINSFIQEGPPLITG